MENVKRLGSFVLSKLKNQSININIPIIIFFILGILLLLNSFYPDNDTSTSIENSGMIGFYFYSILLELFGVSSYFVGPIFILLSIKSFLKSNMEFLKNGFFGLLIFLFSFSTLFSQFETEKGGFIGKYLSNLGIFLLGKTGLFILTLLLFFISLFYIFSLHVQDLKSFYLNHFNKEKSNPDFKIVSLFISLLPFILSFINLFKKKEHIKNDQDLVKSSENLNKSNLSRHINMDMFKNFNLFNTKKNKQATSEKKPPWIQKVEIDELNDNNKEFNINAFDHVKIHDEENQVFSNNIINQNPIYSPHSPNKELKRTIESDLSISIRDIEKDFFQNSNPYKYLKQEKLYTQGRENEKIHILFDDKKDRFLFTDEITDKKKIPFYKKKFNVLESKDLLGDITLDPEVYKFISNHQVDDIDDVSQVKEHIKYESENQNEFNLNEHNLVNNFNEEVSNLTTIENFYKEKNDINEDDNHLSSEHISSNVLVLNQDEQKHEHTNIEDQNKNKEVKQSSDSSVNNEENHKNNIQNDNHLFTFNPKYLQQKIKELQEQIISSESLTKPYRLSTHHFKFESSFHIDGISIQQEIQENWKKLEQVLNDYGIKGQVVGATRGPMITMFEIRLEPGVRVNRILSLQDEIRMNLAALSVRIVAPIPGKSTIGIEIPNKTREFVTLGELLHKDPEFFSKKRDINILLGKDVSGKTRYIDLTRLPHLLIAGATGSGKSVFLNSIIASLLYQYSPEQIRFLMIDPKMVELKLYEGIPHLLYPVIIDVKLAEKALFWAVNEMENRYKLFSLAKCRDLRSYNEKIKKGSLEGNPIPYIVIVIDELSDLMMIAAKEVEESIIRLTQKARAVGIHLILATQRPSVDVITALIKANCPARISFQVAQKVDSRIILDTNGSESLLGKGDMLYRSPASTLPIRIQAPNITEEEIEIIVKETQKYDFSGYIELPEEEEIISDFGFNQVDEELISKAWKIILETGKTSTSYIQRRLRIGYNRAANIMEKLEEMGYLSPANGNKPREILKRQ